jgi:predicted CXXCH cytochrome family protein
MWRRNRLLSRLPDRATTLAWTLALVGFVVLARPEAATAQPARATAATANQCATCHGGLAGALAAGDVASDVHGSRGFTCADCHGGDASATDKVAAHAVARGFKGVLGGAAIVAACARCHADPGFMRTYAPAQRVDQAAEYATSVHGKRLATGDTKVATCASCHGGHGVRRVSDAKSPVYPLNVATTCAKCHADPAHMAGYTTASGAPLPTNQFEGYAASVHAKALVGKQDLSAPTCNDCHGNHGAAPPGAGAVVNVCGTCHAVFAERFATSVHKDVFERGCVECHENHHIKQPSDALLGTAPESLCPTCHSDDAGATAAAAMHAQITGLQTAVERAEQQLRAVRNAGLEVGDEELKLREARNHLVLSRTEVHTFNPDAVTKVATEGLALTTGVVDAAAAGERELAFRRRGLAAAMVAFLVVVIGLVWKIRQIERRPG